MNDLARLACDGRVATLTLNRPDARNALSIELLDTLHARVDELAKREDVTAVVVTGEGKSFCAGMDLKAVLSGPDLPLKLLSSLAEFTIKLRALPQVTVAKVNGAAIGGGCGLACVCDIATTHADSKMGFPEVDLGVCPAVVAPWLVKKIGAGPARRVLLTGGLMSGQQAFEMGIVNHVVPLRGALDAATDELVKRLASGGPNALRATKRLLNEIDGSIDGALVRRGAELSAQVVADPVTQAVLRAKLGG
jgi:enoyl-CoA hydratase/carnithine racemase